MPRRLAAAGAAGAALVAALVALYGAPRPYAGDPPPASEPAFARAADAPAFARESERVVAPPPARKRTAVPATRPRAPRALGVAPRATLIPAPPARAAPARDRALAIMAESVEADPILAPYLRAARSQGLEPDADQIVVTLLYARSRRAAPHAPLAREDAARARVEASRDLAPFLETILGRERAWAIVAAAMRESASPPLARRAPADLAARARRP